MIFKHPDNIQGFDCYRLVLAAQSRRQLMQKIEPNIGNSFVESRQFDTLFLAISTAEFLPRQPTLCGFEFLRQLLKRTGIIDNVAATVSAERLKSDINSDRAAAILTRIFFALDHERYEVFIGSSMSDRRFDYALCYQFARLHKFHQPQLRQLYFVADYAYATLS